MCLSSWICTFMRDETSVYILLQKVCRFCQNTTHFGITFFFLTNAGEIFLCRMSHLFVTRVSENGTRVALQRQKGCVLLLIPLHALK